MTITFSVATIEEFESAEAGLRTFLAKSKDPSPLEAYLVLKNEYGEPERDYLNEIKQQWVFLLKTENALIEVYDWKQDSWSIAVYERGDDEDEAKKIANALLQKVKNGRKKIKSDLSAILKQGFIGQVIENPFFLYYNTATELLGLAKKLSISNVQKEPTIGKITNWDTEETLCRAAYFQFVASVEGLLNLIYDIYLRQELREDRIVNRLAREQIDIKIRLAPVYCECFGVEAIDHSTEAFRKFHSLANLRNDFIHANLTKSMRTQVVEHERAIYLNYTDSKDLLSVSLSNYGIEQIKEVQSIIDGIVAQVVGAMKPRFRKEFSEILHEPHIEVEFEDGIPVIVH
ncbi:MAG: hypothetical protein SD837_02540 [Candidatus Electrothrix scaldis]|nr:MAG: hypothetical protein SD837_02540 [Candidatus Electrothrix sp. GW3-3]